ncbi:MAG TPA: YkgJ family cysteine cluster protein [Polyangiales bacterium]
MPRSAATCTACGLCCSYVAIEVDQPSTVKRATQLLWYVYHEGVSLYVNEDEWMVQFETTCRFLQPDYRCGIYATRPHICREFSEKDCEVNTGDDGLTFYTGAEFLAHLQRSRPRVYALVQKSYLPPEASPRTELAPFEQRFNAVRTRRAALGI